MAWASVGLTGAVVAQAASADPTLRAEALLLAGESELKLKRYTAALKAFSGVTASEAVEQLLGRDPKLENS